MKKRIEKMYLDYLNNYLTVRVFAICYDMSEEKAARVLAIGRKLCERY